MNEHGLTKENLLSAFPVALRETPELMALAGTVAEALEKRAVETGRARIYPDVMSLPEDLLDILAVDFKIDWWDPNYSLEEKRRIFRDSWYVHKHLGTKAAVTTALRAVYPKAVVEEWFDYGGEPYHFKLKIDLSSETSDAARPWRALDRVNFYKSLRSHIDAFEFTMNAPPLTLHVGGRAGAQAQVGVPQGADVYDFRAALHTGGAGGIHGETPVPAGKDNYSFSSRLYSGGRGGILADTGLAENREPPPATTILRTGGVCTILSNLSKGE